MTLTKQFHSLNTFKPYAVFYRTGGQIEKFHFINGWGASVANHNGSYGGTDGLRLLRTSPINRKFEYSMISIDFSWTRKAGVLPSRHHYGGTDGVCLPPDPPQSIEYLNIP